MSSADNEHGGRNHEYENVPYRREGNHVIIGKSRPLSPDFKASHETDDKNIRRALEQIRQLLLGSSKPLDKDVAQVLYDNLWDMYESEEITMPRRETNPEKILHEYTSDEVASIAGKVLSTGKATAQEIRILAASVLTQARPKEQ